MPKLRPTWLNHQQQKRTNANLYGRTHQATRRRIAPFVDAGMALCGRCGERIIAGELWDLDHDDWDKSRYNGAAHRRCNRDTSAVRWGRKNSRLW